MRPGSPRDLSRKIFPSNFPSDHAARDISRPIPVLTDALKPPLQRSVTAEIEGSSPFNVANFPPECDLAGDGINLRLSAFFFLLLSAGTWPFGSELSPWANSARVSGADDARRKAIWVVPWSIPVSGKGPHHSRADHPKATRRFGTNLSTSFGVGASIADVVRHVTQLPGS